MKTLLAPVGAVAFLYLVLGPLGFRLRFSEVVGLVLGKENP
jgi:hypothetical protein